MKKTILLAAVMMLFAAVACSGSRSEDLVAPPDAEQEKEQEQESMKTKIKITVGGREFDVTLEDNAAARDFVSRLPLTLQMEDLNRNEKYGYVSGSLPANAQRVETINAGDLMLWTDNCIVLFYKTFTSGYSYTRLGRLDSVSGLAEAVGDKDVEVTFSLSE